jgi:hypothetical protein
LPNPSCSVGVEQLQIWSNSWGFWWWCMAFVLKDFLATFALYVFEYDIAFWGQVQSLSSSLLLPKKVSLHNNYLPSDKSRLTPNY